MENQREWIDKTLGRMVLRVNARARNIIFRTKGDGIYVTVPPRTSQVELVRALEQLRPRLEKSRSKVPEKQKMGWGYQLDLPRFQMRIVEGKGSKIVARYREGGMNIECPSDTDFDDASLQVWLEKVIERGLKRTASACLPKRLMTLAHQAGLTYTGVKITSSKSRWGSCSAGKSINLSCYLLRLPDHLIDYVLLHELCHTVEMNHGERFWALLNSLTDGKAHALRNEMKQYNTGL